MLDFDLWNIMFVDAEGNGNTGYLLYTLDRDISPRYVAFWAHDGQLIWRRRVDVVGPGEDQQEIGDWAMADFDNDGALEFAITTPNGIDLIEADGTVIATMGRTLYQEVKFANVDDDAALELVAADDGRIETWDLEDGHVGTIDQHRVFRIGRLSESSPRDYVQIGCDLLDIDGTKVAEVPPDEQGSCRYTWIDHGEAFLIEGFNFDEAYDRRDTFPLDDFAPVELFVHFEAGEDAFRVVVSYSYETEIPFIAGWVLSNPTRAILQVFDGTGSLVYHEVIASKSGPGSLVVIPAEVEGQEVLLLADDTHILAYRLASQGGGE